MIRPQTRSTRNDTPVPDTTLFRSKGKIERLDLLLHPHPIDARNSHADPDAPIIAVGDTTILERLGAGVEQGSVQRVEPDARIGGAGLPRTQSQAFRIDNPRFTCGAARVDASSSTIGKPYVRGRVGQVV